MNVFDANSFSWEKPQKTIDLNKFFENKAYQNLFSELKESKNIDANIEDDDNSTTAPESRTVSTLSVVGNIEKMLPMVKIEEKVHSESNFAVKLKEKICQLLEKPIDEAMIDRFKNVVEFEMETINIE